MESISPNSTSQETSSAEEKEQEQAGPMPQPTLACESCRRRKIKCDREVPYCSVCVKSSSVCRYPSGPIKPGPKLGQSHRRKRARTSETQDSKREDDRAQNHLSGAQPEGDANKRYLDMMQNIEYPEEIRRMSEVSYSMMRLAEHELSNVRGAPLSPEQTVAGSTPKSDRLSMHNLSFIIHPSHEACNRNGSPAGSAGNEFPDKDGDASAEPLLMARACCALNIQPLTMHTLIELYFANMTSFSLFRQPTFDAKLRAITSSTQLNALLASMFAYSVRFDTQEIESFPQGNFSQPPDTGTRSDNFLDMALNFIEQALVECADEAPSLELLQAMILTTFQQLVSGVRGRAWRALGRCVRIAYELYLHLIDTNKGIQSFPYSDAEAAKWSNDEERRRAWWAIWEMDVFACTIRRCPTSIDWTQIEVYLPAEDTAWFQGKVQRSCFLERKPIDRWGTLQNTNNPAPKAWFIVVNSLMRDAQVLSNPRGVLHLDRQNSNAWTSKSNNATDRGKFKTVSDRLIVLENSLRCFTMALPSDLKYRDEYLTFSSPDPSSVVAIRRLHSARYAIHMMTQLTKFMIHHYNVFESPVSKECPNKGNSPNSEDMQALPMLDRQALNRYMEAAESIVTLVNRSADSHVKYVNPFAASTIWLAAAVQLIFSVFCPPGTSKSRVNSNFKVLRLNYSQFIDCWKTSTALQANLDLLETQLHHYKEPKTAEQQQQIATQPDLAESNTVGYADARPSLTVEEEGAAALQSLGEGLFPNHNQQKLPSTYISQANAVEEMPQLDGAYDPSVPSSAVMDSIGFGFDFGGESIDLPYYLNGLLSGSFIE